MGGFGYEKEGCIYGTGISHNLSPDVRLVPCRIMLLFMVARR